ncbi:MAG: flagellar export chaperone FlgN [Planctomycetota bacterium]
MTAAGMLARQLTATIDAIAMINEELEALASRQRDAMRRVDADAVAGVTTAQRAAGEQLGGLEIERRRQAVALASALGVGAHWSLEDLSGALRALDADAADALDAAAARARSAVLAAQRRQRVVQAAASGLMAHLDGLARQVAARVSQAGTYAATGAIVTTSTAMGVDLVS